MRQLGFFDGAAPLKITKPIRLIELFGGIGAQAKALERIGANFQHYRYCEFDEYAVTSYNAIHGTDFKKSDVREWHGANLGIVEKDKYTYLLTYSFPCQDLSLCGAKRGMAEGSGTRSSLLWEVKRLLDETDELPDVLLMENVPQVIGAGNLNHFLDFIAYLTSLGYESKWDIINSRDHDVPQNRERCFMVSWLGDYYYDFPGAKPLNKVLRDLLQPEDEIDEKYYLSDAMIEYFTRHTEECKEKGNGFAFTPTEGDTCARCITTRAGGRMDDNFIKCNHVGNIKGDKYDKLHDISKRVYATDGLAPTIHTSGGGQQEPKIITEPHLVGGIGEKKSNGGTQWFQQDRVYCADSVAMAHLAEMSGGGYKYLVGNEDDLHVYDLYNRKEIDSTRTGTITAATSHTASGTFLIKRATSPIRKLTQRECWRLMDFDDSDFDKAREALNNKHYGGKDRSGSQLYKQAGNSIVVRCLEHIFEKMLGEHE